jgi:hypothetical protein
LGFQSPWSHTEPKGRGDSRQVVLQITLHGINAFQILEPFALYEGDAFFFVRKILKVNSHGEVGVRGNY